MGYSWDLITHGFPFSFSHGQSCSAGSRIFVQSSIYDEFLERFTASQGIKLGDPSTPGTHQGPQISQAQYDCIMSYVQSGKEEGATCQPGGDHFETEGFYINPTIFTDVMPDMRVVKEEIVYYCHHQTEEGEIQFFLSSRTNLINLGIVQR